LVVEPEILEEKDTYDDTGVINPILAFILGVLVFFTAGAAACNYGNSRIAKRKTNHTQS
jgi:hypothetical protein